MLDQIWSGRERRVHRRKQVEGAVSLRVGESWQNCRILDMSEGGAAFLSSHRPPIGMAVLVKIADLGYFTCRVLRHRREGFAAAFVSADFSDSLDLEAMAPRQLVLPFETLH